MAKGGQLELIDIGTTSLTCAYVNQIEMRLAPRGLDAANLWFGSLAVPEIADGVYDARRSDVGRRTGQVMQLFKCAELLSWADESEPLFVPRST